MRKTWTLIVKFIACSLLVVVSILPARAQDAPDAALWSALAEGRAVAMMRHALAPGGGDPAGFEIGNCATQRNLSDEGRDQARAIGATFRENGIEQAEVLTSQWCRCAETARLLAIGDAVEFEPLNSFFQNRSQSLPQTQALRDFLQQRPAARPLVLVTHQVNITALTGIFPRSGEIVFFTIDENGSVNVLGTI
ncbi:MAG: histidine phosphatase family protein [Ahrensia sp.]